MSEQLGSWLISFHDCSGEPCELYHCVLESKSFLEKMTVIEHTVPFFLPIREAENDLLSSNAMVRFLAYIFGCLFYIYIFLSLFLFSNLFLYRFLTVCFQKFIDHVGELLQAYVDRREQVCFSFSQVNSYLRIGSQDVWARRCQWPQVDFRWWKNSGANKGMTLIDIPDWALGKTMNQANGLGGYL